MTTFPLSNQTYIHPYSYPVHLMCKKKALGKRKMVAGTPVYIAVMGPVGSGKSTFIDNMIDKRKKEDKVPIRPGLLECTYTCNS